MCSPTQPYENAHSNLRELSPAELPPVTGGADAFFQGSVVAQQDKLRIAGDGGGATQGRLIDDIVSHGYFCVKAS